MNWSIPPVEAASLRVERRPAGLKIVAPSWLLMLGLPLVPGFTAWSGLTFGELALVLGGHVALVVSIALPPANRLPDDHRLVRCQFSLAPFFNVVLTSLIGGLARDPASTPFWGFHFLYAAVLAQAYRAPSAVFALLLLLGPLLVLAGLGVAAHGLAAAVVVGVGGATLYTLLARDAARRRAIRDALEEARLVAMRAAGERSRLQLVHDVTDELSGSVEAASLTAEQARARFAQRATGVDEVLVQMVRRLRGALHALRGAVWALDPDALAWPAVEAHLRRIAAELAAPHACTFVADVAADTVVEPANRLRLLRALCAALAVVESDVRVALHATEDGVGLTVEQTPSIVGCPSPASLAEDSAR